MDAKLSDHTRMESKVENTEIVCSPCIEQNERIIAVRYCEECEDYYCISCVDRHNWFPALRNHKLAVTNRLGTNQHRSSMKFMCTKHEEEVIKSFCPTHDEVLCVKCVTGKHRY